MIKCIIPDCDKESTMDSPADLCYKHWLDWWNGNNAVQKEIDSFKRIKKMEEWKAKRNKFFDDLKKRGTEDNEE